jgi:lipopolysaccharide heptosyltransferase II
VRLPTWRMTIFSCDRRVDLRKICVLHLNQIGDLVFSLPLLKALREFYPRAEIHSVVRPHLGALLQDSPHIDMAVQRKRGILNDLRLLSEIRRTRYDLVISLSDSPSCLMIAGLSRAKGRVGFRHFPWDAGLNVKEVPEGYHSWHNDLKLLKRLNIPVAQMDYVGLLTLRERKDSEGSMESWGSRIGDHYAVLSPGTSVRRGMKAWEEKKFGELIVLLKKTYGFTPVLVGDEKDREVNDRVIEEAKQRDKDAKRDSIVNLAGKTNLVDLCRLLKRASLFVGVDSGIMHLASSLDIPVVGIFGPTDPSLVGPQNKKSVVVQKKEMECVPCDLKGCEERGCLTGLDVKEVFDSCEQVLSR